MKKIALLLTAVLFSFTGCATLQKDISINAEDTVNSEKIEDIENQLIELDSSFVLNENKLSKDEAAQVDFLKKEVEKELKQPHIDKVVQSRLLAIKGRCAFMQGKKSEAKKCSTSAKEKYENDTQLLILERRLGIITDMCEYRTKMNSDAITIEDAIEHFEKGEYDVSSGLFDSVFIKPENLYKTPYEPLREKAWSLRNTDSKNSPVNLSQSSITVSQMMTLTNSKEGLLDYYTAGKKYEGKSLYQLLTKAGLMKSTDGTSDNISEKTEVTRILAARFLWNLYSTKNSINPVKYSTKYRSRENAKSPVADIEISDPDFDAVLGTVENEIMSLPDGKNFEPLKLYSAAEFDGSLKNIK